MKTPLAFDHLVVMLRDELEARAPAYVQAGYTLSDLSVHNLGSANRLIVLDSAYIELLGWPAGEPPRRKEIADQPIGLDALVFRSEHAQEDQLRLQRAGLDVQPVGRLERPIEFHGEPGVARFDTVRFNTQPVPGLRMYLCRHLTPQYVWDAPLMRHANGAAKLEEIDIAAPDPASAAGALSAVTGATATPTSEGAELALPNLTLRILKDAGAAQARISAARLRHADGGLREFQVNPAS